MILLRSSFIGVALALAPTALAAPAVPDATFAITVRDARGVPVRDAVVTVHPARGPGTAAPLPMRQRMIQRDIAFQPGTLVVPVGAEVGFPNQDKVRHHVYSFSKPARFELELYGRDQSRTQRFAIAGTVALGCNIHDRMQGYIRVVDTPFAAKTDERGQVRIAALPSGKARVTVWHPRQRAPGGETRYDIAVAAGGTVNKNLTLALRDS